MSYQQHQENEWRALQAQVKPKTPKFFVILTIGLLAGGGVGFILGLFAKGMMGIIQ